MALLVINAAYSFDGTFNTVENYHFYSNPFKDLSEKIGQFPLPLPRYYVMGLDMVMTHDELGHRAFLNGEVKTDGWFYYFIEAALLKSQIAFLILLIVYFYFSYKKISQFNSVFIWLPAITFLVFASMSKIDIGVKYILPVYLLSCILVGGIVNIKFRDEKSSERMVYFIIVILAIITLTSLFAWPNYISYFNELVGSNDYKYLADSNIDWGQDSYFITKYMAHNPDVVLNPGCKMTKGKIIVTVNSFDGILADEHCYDWLRNHEPIGVVGGSGLIFNISS